MTINDPELQRWREHLTPELRTYFERRGLRQIELQLALSSITPDRIEWAARAWVHEQRVQQAIKERYRRRLTEIAAVAAVLAALFAFLGLL